MHHAVWSGKMETVELLLIAGCDVNARCIDGRSALFLARTPAAIVTLVKHGASLEVVDEVGSSVLHQVAQRGPEENIGTSLRLGADLLATNRDGDNPVSYAVLHDQPGVLWTFLHAIPNEHRERLVCCCSICLYAMARSRLQ